MLTAEEKERYRRQLILPDIGEEGQVRIKNAKVLVVGAGGLGSPVLYYLAAMGVGTLGIVDADEVELSNLQRQIIHKADRIGQNKAISAAQTIGELNSSVGSKTYPYRLTKENSRELIKKFDIVVTALDNFATRYVINQACVSEKKPMIEAGVADWQGLATTILPGKTPCYRCIFPQIADGGRGEIGLPGCLPGVMGTIQATETIKVITGVGETLANRLLLFDAKQMHFTELSIEKNASCPVCGEQDNFETSLK